VPSSSGVEGCEVEAGEACGVEEDVHGRDPPVAQRDDRFLERTPDPTEAEIREAISGNLCRCTGYENIVKAVQWAARNGSAQEVGA